jgi:hypothetical protein
MMVSRRAGLPSPPSRQMAMAPILPSSPLTAGASPDGAVRPDSTPTVGARPAFSHSPDVGRWRPSLPPPGVAVLGVAAYPSGDLGVVVAWW